MYVYICIYVCYTIIYIERYCIYIYICVYYGSHTIIYVYTCITYIGMQLYVAALTDDDWWVDATAA